MSIEMNKNLIIPIINSILTNAFIKKRGVLPIQGSYTLHQIVDGDIVEDDSNNSAFKYFLSLEKEAAVGFWMIDNGIDKDTMDRQLEEDNSGDGLDNYCIFRYYDFYFRLDYKFYSYYGAVFNKCTMSIVSPKEKTITVYE